MKTTRLGAMAVCCLVFLTSPPGQSQTPSFQWATRLASTINDDNELSIGLVIDTATNLYVTGWFDGTNDFGGVTLTNRSGGGQDIFVGKYTSSGVLQWVRRAGGSSPDRDGGRGIGVDDAGNVYVTGEFVGNSDFGGFNLPGSTDNEFFLVKYDGAGTVQWVRQSLGGFGVYGTGLAVDGAGNCYAVGYADNGASITFGTNNLVSPYFTGYSAFLVKYDADGEAVWAQLLGGPGQTYATKVAVDAAGNVYVRGSFSENITIGTSNLVCSRPSDEDEDMFIAKFDHAGTLTWVRQSAGANIDEGGVAVDPAGNVYVSGWFIDGSANFGGIILTNAGVGDAFVTKYNAAGVVQWARRAGGTGLDFFWDVAVDQWGNVYAAGFLSSDAVAPSGTGGTIIAKYNSLGALQWAKSADGLPADPVASTAAKCAVDASGDCYLVGWYQTATTFGANTLQPLGYWNYFLAKVGFRPLTLGIVRSNTIPLLKVSGEAGNRFALEYATALATGDTWQSLITNTLTSLPFVIPDTNATGSPSRFYRARLVP